MRAFRLEEKDAIVESFVDFSDIELFYCVWQWLLTLIGIWYQYQYQYS